MGGIDLTATSVSKEQKVTLQVKPKDILVFVPGTTDPPNATAAQHEANKKYWEENTLLFNAVKELKKEFLDLHIQDEFFSWTGDNSKEERAKAGNRLRLLLYARPKNAVYNGWINLPVALHLIGHSHGGNVINEFTKAIVEHKDFPKRWTIKSITYLSTPFFNKLHQLDKTHLHPECRILNVYNHFDITQRAIADYSLHQLPPVADLVKNNPDIKNTKANLSKLNTSVFSILADYDTPIDDENAGPALWRTTRTLLSEVATGLNGAVKLIAELHTNHPTVVSGNVKKILTDFLSGLRGWALGAAARFQARLDITEPPGRWEDRYKTTTFVSDLDMLPLLNVLNSFFELDEAKLSSPLLDVIDDVLAQRIDVVDDTTATPKKQVPSNLEIIDIPVRKYDKYNGLYDQAYGTFIAALEKDEKALAANPTSQGRRSVVLRLLAQLDYSVLRTIASKIDTAEYGFFGDTDTALTRLRRATEAYLRLLDARNAHLAVPADFIAGLLAKQASSLGEKTIDDVREEIEDGFPHDPAFLTWFNEFVRNERLKDKEKASVLLERMFAKRNKHSPYWTEMTNFSLDHQRGSIAYLAVFSHSISRSALYQEVRDALIPAFVSGKNPGYGVKKK